MGIRWRGKREEVLEIRERREWVKERKEEERRSARRRKWANVRRERSREWVRRWRKRRGNVTH